VAFTASGHLPSELAGKLSAYKLGVGVGHFYAYRLIEALGIDTDQGALRVSLVHYTSQEEVDQLVFALDQLL
jgi:selenocysteine lyase/cysteine desulfurase